MSQPLPPLTPPITILQTHTATNPTTLRFKNHGSGGSTITQTTPSQEPPKDLFKIGPKKPGITSTRREYRCATTGDLLLELRRDFTSTQSHITLAGASQGDANPKPVATFAPRGSPLKDKFDVFVRVQGENQNQNQGEGEGEREVKLEVRGQDVWKKNTYVYFGEKLVMQVRFVNMATAYIPFASNEWDVFVAQGFDLSLATAIVGYLAASLYDSPYFKSRPESARQSPSEVSADVKKGAVMGAIAGGAAGGGGGGG